MTATMPAFAPASPPANKKWHTKPCIYFQTSQCPFSAEECDFAHVYDIQAATGPDALKSKYRTKPCRYYLQGSCSQGTWCRFKHPVGTFPRTVTDDEDEDDFAAVPDVRDVDPQAKLRRELHPKYKTRPCREWLMGTCQRGESCSYMHERIPRASAPPAPPMYAYPYSPYMAYPPGVAPPGAAEPLTPPLRGDDPRMGLDASPGLMTHSSPSDSSFNDDAPRTPIDAAMPFLCAPKMLAARSDRAVYAVPPYGSPVGSPMAAMHPSMPMALFYGAPWQPPMPSLPVVSPNARARSQPPGGRRRASSCRAKAHQQPLPSSRFSSGVRRDSVQEPESAQSPLSAKPPSATRDTGLASPLEDQQNKDYWPITWRVVGGGVKMALPDDEKAPPAFAGDSERALALVNTGPTVFVEDQCLAADTSKLGVPVASIYVKGHSARKNMSISIPGPIPFVGLEVENEAKARARSTPASPSREPVDLPKLFSSMAI